MTPNAFLDALSSSERASELADVDDIFGWLIGSWEVDAILYDAEGRTRTVTGEVHASWVLEGRAIQDVFIFPGRANRHSGVPAHGDRYATTIRTYDRSLGAWRVNFINPAADDTSAQLIARRTVDGISMEGHLSDGTPIRWRYDGFPTTSFHYTGEQRRGDAQSWSVYLELFGRRASDEARICRVWHGWTTPPNAEAYETVVRGEVIPGIEARHIPGFRQIDLLRRRVGDEVEFTTLMWFDSLDSVRAFMGEDYAVSHVPAAARGVLSRFDARGSHYQVVERRPQG